MIYCLDTNICIYFLKGSFPAVSSRLRELDPVDLKIPSMVKAELLLGAEKSRNRSDNLKKVRLFLTPYEIVPFDSEAAEIYAVIRSRTEKKGSVVGPNDLVIAATALTLNACLVTGNTNDFSRIDGLKTVDWTA